jgi:hypothetical protein
MRSEEEGEEGDGDLYFPVISDLLGGGVPRELVH